MNNYEIDSTNENQIMETINSDILLRNEKLNILMDIINKINKNMIISVDGKWGSGKTVFVKQLMYLFINEAKITYNNKIDNKILDEFKNRNLLFYYNAWENDFHTNPLLSIMYKILNDYPNEKNQISDENSKFAVDFVSGVKTLTQNFIKLDNIKSYKDLVDEIKTSEEIKKSLNTLINSLLSDNKKMVIIIDELDRCKPSFAIEMLETIKHYYDNDKIVFIVSTNNEQLSHMICKLYGDKFGGYEYLNKFYDFVINLDDVEVENYINYYLDFNDKNNYNCSIVLEIIKQHKFSFREINRYVSSLNLVSNYLKSEDSFLEKFSYYRLLLAPYAIALKIKSNKKFNDFISGSGLDDLLSFCKFSPEFKKIIDGLYKYSFKKDPDGESEFKIIEEIYIDLTVNKNLYSERLGISQIYKKKFYNVISLLGVKQ